MAGTIIAEDAADAVVAKAETPRPAAVPKSISGEAQAALALKRPARSAYPASDDVAGWRGFIERRDAEFAAQLTPVTAALPVRVASAEIGGVPIFVAVPDRLPPGNHGKALLYIHGGGLVFGKGACTGHAAVLQAMATQATVYAVDYRMPPDHPFPAALDDCVAVYCALIEQHAPGSIVLSGTSAGANLAAAAAMRLGRAGTPMPAAIGLFSPELDLTESGDSFQTLAEYDVVLHGGLPELNALYAAGADLADRALSPLFDDVPKGFPPTFLQAGTRDTFLSNAVRMHRKLRTADIVAELHVWEAMPHVGFGGSTREDGEVALEFRKFLAKVAGWAAP